MSLFLIYLTSRNILYIVIFMLKNIFLISCYCAKYNSPGKPSRIYYKSSLLKVMTSLYYKNILNVGEKRKGILYLFILFSLSLNHPFYFWGRGEGGNDWKISSQSRELYVTWDGKGMISCHFKEVSCYICGKEKVLCLDKELYVTKQRAGCKFTW